VNILVVHFEIKRAGTTAVENGGGRLFGFVFGTGSPKSTEILRLGEFSKSNSQLPIN
jgi:hypothetical protein